MCCRNTLSFGNDIERRLGQFFPSGEITITLKTVLPMNHSLGSSEYSVMIETPIVVFIKARQNIPVYSRLCTSFNAFGSFVFVFSQEQKSAEVGQFPTLIPKIQYHRFEFTIEKNE